MEDFTEIIQQENKIMASAELDDMEKLKQVFHLRKNELKKHFPQLYYCILAILDQQKVGAHHTNEDQIVAVVNKVNTSSGSCELLLPDGTIGYTAADLMNPWSITTHAVGSRVVVKHIKDDYYKIIAAESSRFN